MSLAPLTKSEYDQSAVKVGKKLIQLGKSLIGTSQITRESEFGWDASGIKSAQESATEAVRELTELLDTPIAYDK